MLPHSFPDSRGRLLRLWPDAPRKGGQAEVFKADLLGRTVALKVYHRGFPRAEAERTMLEAILRDDPNAAEWLVTVLGSGAVEGRPFLVLPWIEASLSDWLPGRPLPARVAAVCSAAEAVARLHRSRRDLTGYRVHRDIKPDNLLVAWEGRWVVRLADLGAAKDGASLAHTTNTGVLTETFAPPEQALPVDQEPRESWDVHALAVTAFYGLTTRVPIVALEAPGLLNADGRRLVTLARKGLYRALTSKEERERYQALRRKRPEELLDLDTAVGWRAEDEAWLGRALEDHGIDAEDAREALVRPLAHALAGALDPDWRRRDNDARKLLAALIAWRDALPGAPLQVDAASGSWSGEPAPATPPFSMDPAVLARGGASLGEHGGARVGEALLAGAPEAVGAAPTAAPPAYRVGATEPGETEDRSPSSGAEAPSGGRAGQPNTWTASSLATGDGREERQPEGQSLPTVGALLEDNAPTDSGRRRTGPGALLLGSALGLAFLLAVGALAVGGVAWWLAAGGPDGAIAVERAGAVDGATAPSGAELVGAGVGEVAGVQSADGSGGAASGTDGSPVGTGAVGASARSPEAEGQGRAQIAAEPRGPRAPSPTSSERAAATDHVPEARAPGRHGARAGGGTGGGAAPALAGVSPPERGDVAVGAGSGGSAAIPTSDPPRSEAVRVAAVEVFVKACPGAEVAFGDEDFSVLPAFGRKHTIPAGTRVQLRSLDTGETWTGSVPDGPSAVVFHDFTGNPVVCPRPRMD